MPASLASMAYSQTDLDNLDAAIAGGELTVRVLDRLVEYRSIDELLQARAHVAARIAEASSTAVKLSPRHRRAVFAD